MSARNNTVPRRTTPIGVAPNPLEMCLAAAVKDDEMARDFLPPEVLAAYIAVRLDQLVALEYEHDGWLQWTPAFMDGSGRWAA